MRRGTSGACNIYPHVAKSLGPCQETATYFNIGVCINSQLPDLCDSISRESGDPPEGRGVRRTI
jgi:hypothetical protein